jgi:hypothetical protein
MIDIITAYTAIDDWASWLGVSLKFELGTLLRLQTVIPFRKLAGEVRPVCRQWSSVSADSFMLRLVLLRAWQSLTCEPSFHAVWECESGCTPRQLYTEHPRKNTWIPQFPIPPKSLSTSNPNSEIPKPRTCLTPLNTPNPACTYYINTYSQCWHARQPHWLCPVLPTLWVLPSQSSSSYVHYYMHSVIATQNCCIPSFLCMYSYFSSF